jgi:hypothetical protein
MKKLKEENTTSPVQIFIGYEESERRAYDVCVSSIEQRSNIKINKLHTSLLPNWYREKEPHQSTDFTYTRFLCPELMDFKGISIFCDCDFLWLANPARLIDYIRINEAVAVCKHPVYTPNSAMKMDGKVQHQMPRKNWASMVVFNNEHPSNKILTNQYVNEHMPGRDLHQFKWLKDEEIGSIPLDWNCLDDYYMLENPKAIHYTDGGPWFDNYKKTMYSDIWIEEERILNET